MDTVKATRDGSIVTLTFNAVDGPSKITQEFCEAIVSHLDDITKLSGVRAIVMKGPPKIFSAGGDLFDIIARIQADTSQLEALIQSFHDCVLAIRNFPLPVIASVLGTAAGGGFSLALAADFIIAGASARFVVGYPKIGAPSDGGLTYHLSRLLGRRGAIGAFLLTNEFHALKAKELGLVDAVVDDKDLDSETKVLAESFASHSPYVLKEIKSLVNNATEEAFAKHLQLEKEAFIRCSSSPDFIDRLNAVARKKKG